MLEIEGLEECRLYPPCIYLMPKGANTKRQNTAYEIKFCFPRRLRVPAGHQGAKGVKPARVKLQAPKGKSVSVTGRKSATARLAISTAPHEPAVREVLALIEGARERAFEAVNTELIDLYWRVVEYVSRKIETAAWG